MNTTKSILILSAALFLGCVTNQKEKSDVIKSNQSYTLEKSDVISNGQTDIKEKNAHYNLLGIEYHGDSLKMEQNKKEFSEFILIFERAVAEKDSIKIKSLSNFPFETRGVLDHYPHIFYSESNFIEVFNSFLNQEIAKDLNSQEIDKVFSRYIQLDKKISITDDWGRIMDMQFKKVNGNWKFYFVYLSDQTIEKLKNVPQQRV